MKLPATIKKFDQIAQEHGWRQDLIETEEDVAFARVYSRSLGATTDFSFVIGFGLRPETNRWVMFETDSGETFLGVLFENEYPITEWGWSRRSDLGYWLARPEQLFEVGITIPDKVRRQIAAVFAERNET